MTILTTVLILVALDLLISPWNKEIPTIVTGTTAILMIMTIITGVKSPWILGKPDATQPSPQAQQFNEELGIETL